MRASSEGLFRYFNGKYCIKKQEPPKPKPIIPVKPGKKDDEKNDASKDDEKNPKTDDKKDQNGTPPVKLEDAK